MFDWSGETGLAALFAAAFVSATVLPASSELVLVEVLRASPGSAAAAIALPTLGNTLGRLRPMGSAGCAFRSGRRRAIAAVR